jgi:hypothetical protein
MITLTATAPDPLSRSTPSHRPPLRVGLVQHRWRADSKELTTALRYGIDRAAGEGARVVFLPEITLLRYPADTPAGPNPGAAAEDLVGGPTFELVTEAAIAKRYFRARLAVGAPADADWASTRSWCRPPVSWLPHPAAYPDFLVTRTPTSGPDLRATPTRCTARRSGRPHRHADLLGRMVPGGRPQLLARRRLNRRLPNGDRL